ncbi:MAG: RsmB/NOP family class I SAM-dependent RNA methyltransferase [Proteobacteria bacterium]|nr:RsmB/NOP family class I SAM-dependent RNA methyltransferase [Pseudomonadota bacterium]
MREAARLAAAIELVAGIARLAEPADRLIADYFRRRRYAGAKDRRAIVERVYGVLRRWQRLHVALELEPPAPARLLVAADVAVTEKRAPAEVAALFEAGAYGAAPLAPPERALLERLAAAGEGALAGAPEWVRHEYPAWLDQPLRARFGARLGPEMDALNRPAPLDLRVNRLKATREEAGRALAEAGIPARPTPLSPLGLRLPAHVVLARSAPYRAGLVEVQDEAAQIAALVAGARPGMTVIDYCAGAGGKSLALAAEMANAGRILACDISRARLRPLAQRLRRAGVAIVETRLLDAEGRAHPPLPEADLVFVDAPCSGSGTWRRNPDAKWRLGPETLAALAREQDRILARAAAVVRPGGRLVYATCSVLGAENEDRIETLLSARKDYRLRPMSDLWRVRLAGEPPPGGPFLALSPHSHGTDGFFVAALERSRR